MILARGSNLPREKYVSFLKNLVFKFEAMRNEPQYAGNDEVSTIIKYLNFELMDAVETFSKDSNGFDQLIDIVNTTADEMNVTSGPATPGGTLAIYHSENDTPEFSKATSEKDAYAQCMKLVNFPKKINISKCTWEEPCGVGPLCAAPKEIYRAPEKGTLMIYSIHTVNGQAEIIKNISEKDAYARCNMLQAVSDASISKCDWEAPCETYPGGVVGCTPPQFRTKQIYPVEKACTRDAKICPDGSTIGRTGPSCEFAACPTANTSVGTLG
jgi:hypothetical protein